jgi:hypothetical protein
MLRQVLTLAMLCGAIYAHAQQNAQVDPAVRFVASIAQLKTALEQIGKEIKDACAREEYRPLFIHTTCSPNDITPEQLTDRSLIAATDKPLYSRFRSESQAFSTRVAAALRSYGGSKGADLASARERADSLFDKNGLELYEGAVSWGDYNKRRKEIADALRDEFSRIARAQ